MAKKYTILSIDGGGIRGIVPAVFLAYIEKQLCQLSNNKQAKLIDYFDFFAGTSTGALIVSALLSPDKNNNPKYFADELLDIYTSNCQDIFNPSILSNIKTASGVLDVKYSPDGFAKVLEYYFKDIELKHLLKPCLIPAYNVSEAKNYFFRQHLAKKDPQYNYLVRDACLAACSALSYFPPMTVKSFGEYSACFLDGGIFAINPSLCAYSEVKKVYPYIDSDNIMLLSIGTGKQTQQYSCDETKHWGSMEWRYPASNIISSSSSEVVHFNIKKIFDNNDSKVNYLRIDPNINEQYYSNMDNCDKNYLDYLVSFANNNIQRYRPQLDSFVRKLLVNKQKNISFNFTQSNKTCVDLLDESAQKYAKNIAFIGFDCKLSFKTLNNCSTNLSQYLLSLTDCNTVAIMLPNVLGFPIALFGAWRGNKTVVLINPLLSKDELLTTINDAGVDTIITSIYFNNNLAKIIDDTSIKYVINSDLSELLPQPKKTIVHLAMNHKLTQTKIMSTKIVQISFNNAISFGKKHHKTQKRHIKTNNIALLQYTGGTSGKLKAAVLTHKNLLANIEQLSLWLPKNMENKNILTALPLYHIFALMINCLMVVKCAMTSVLVINPRDIKQLIKPFKKYQINMITGVNTLYDHLLSYKGFDKLNFSKLESVIAGGMPLHKNTAQKWYEKTNCGIIQGYGLTETSPVISVQPYHSNEFNGSVGYPLMNTKLRLIDTKTYSDKQKYPHPIGEVVVKGAQVTKGYWQHPELNLEVFTNDGFFRTGDLGYVDEKGQLFLIDRLKEMIIVSGFNVYPSEVEAVLNTHNNILESACIATQDSEHNQAVAAFVVKKNNNKKLIEQDVINYAKEHLSAYKVPKIIRFIDILPRSSVGKILKRNLLDISL